MDNIQSQDSLENTRQESSIDSLEIDDDTRTRHQRNIDNEVKELKEILAEKSDVALRKNNLNNSEFNRDVRRKYNRYKRQIRDKLLKEKED